ncbi:MAG: hypothetical protein KAR83_10605, partial [Thermodesulfovibrionales bacterium]|nr:hypothetical protein [Thermodesulfovibrionales bacterium]
IEPQEHWDFSYILESKKSLDQSIKAGAGDESFPVSPPKLVTIVRDVMPPDGILSLDNGMYKIWFARNYKAYEPNTVLLDNALATMGAGLPAAIAAKIVHPEKKVLAICGDGGFMMNSQELETAVRLELDLVILIIRDNSYGMVRWKQDEMGLKDFGLEFSNPDFVKYAESYGAFGHSIKKTDKLGPAIKKAFKSGGIHVIDLPVDYSRNRELLSQCKLDLNSYMNKEARDVPKKGKAKAKD